jgi:hypothetical protein
MVNRNARMKHQLAILCTAALLLLPRYSIFAGNGGSNYSRFGIGDIQFFGSERSAGMGGAAIALLSPWSLNRLNPAGQTQLLWTRFTGTFSYEGFRTTDGSQSVYLSSGNFGGALLAIPLSVDHGFTFAAGFNPYSNVNYDVRAQGAVGSGDYTAEYTGGGGLSTALVGFTLVPVDSVSLGIRLNYLFGQLRSSANVSSSAADFSSTTYERTVNADGFSFTAGFIYSGLAQLTSLKDLRGLNVGGVFSTGTDLSATQQGINDVTTGQDTLPEQDGKIHIPVSGGIGLSWLLAEKYLLAADYIFQRWTDFTYFGAAQPQIKNSARVSFGLEIQPPQETGGSPGSKPTYRFGAYYLSSYYRVRSEPVNEWGLTTGLGMLISGDTRLDLALQYGRRGTTSQQLVTDDIFRFSVTLNVGEKWFVNTGEQ